MKVSVIVTGIILENPIVVSIKLEKFVFVKIFRQVFVNFCDSFYALFFILKSKQLVSVLLILDVQKIL